MKEKIVIFGAGNQGKIIFDIIQLRNYFEVTSFIDDSEQNKKDNLFGIPILFGQSQLKTSFKQGIKKIIIGIGDNSHRKTITETALSLGYSLVSAIHPSAVIAGDVKLGHGIVVKALAVIEPGALIGENTTIGAQSYIGHGVKVGNLVHISGGVRVGGNTIIKNYVDIGIGAVIKNNILIGENSKVGAGTVVIENIPDNYVAFGVPARLLWKRDTWG